MELKSLSQRIECARMESWCLGMIKECLGDSSMRLGVPFIAPRQLGAVGGNLGRPKLPSVGWRTGQPLFMSGARFPSIPGAAERCNFRLVGAPDTVRCTPDTVRCTPDSPVHTGQSGAPSRPLAWATRRARIARPTVALAAVGSPDSPVHHRTVR
jgi:hypothetical protein